MLRVALMFATLSCGAMGLAPSPYPRLAAAQVVDPRSGRMTSALDGLSTSSKNLVVLVPQLGEFDSCEFCEQLVAAAPLLDTAGIGLRVVGIGDGDAGTRFAATMGLPEGVLRVDPTADVHRSLETWRGPGWAVPSWIDDGLLTRLLETLPGGPPEDSSRTRAVGDAWLNYLLMCAGIGAPGTLPEILRGYFGDRSAPERLRSDEVVKAGFVEIGPGVGPVKLGPLRYEKSWKDESGYQRPVELATVRLKHMVEVLGNWDAYVSDARWVDVRGATFLFDGEDLLYEREHPGVLSYSATMARPLTFLAPFLGAQALNPLGLGDNALPAAA